MSKYFLTGQDKLAMSAFACPVARTDTVTNLSNVFAMKDGKDYVAINVSKCIFHFFFRVIKTFPVWQFSSMRRMRTWLLFSTWSLYLSSWIHWRQVPILPSISRLQEWLLPRNSIPMQMLSRLDWILLWSTNLSWRLPSRSSKWFTYYDKDKPKRKVKLLTNSHQII